MSKLSQSPAMRRFYRGMLLQAELTEHYARRACEVADQGFPSLAEGFRNQAAAFATLAFKTSETIWRERQAKAIHDAMTGMPDWTGVDQGADYNAERYRKD